MKEFIQAIRRFLFSMDLREHWLSDHARLHDMEKRLITLEREIEFLRIVKLQPQDGAKDPIVEAPKSSKPRRKRKQAKK